MGADQPSSQEQTEQKEDSLDLEEKAADHGKKLAILQACASRNIDQLRILAESPGGFLSDDVREQAWPTLLGFSSPETPSASPVSSHEVSASSWKELLRHRDEDQVQLDVNRAFVYYPDRENEADIAQKKDELSALIVEVLRRYPFLYYFQGYHDICQVFLLVLPSQLRVPAVARLSVLRIRDFMLPSLQPAIAQLRLIPAILRAADPALWRHLSALEPFFALSGTLTMYAHDITTLGEIARLFDVLLAQEPVFTVYLYAAIVRSRRKELFETPSDEPEMLHSILSKLPPPPLFNIDELIASAAALFAAYPPDRLPGPAWRMISSASVLKTARDPRARAEQTMEDGRAFFSRQVNELQWIERRKHASKVLRKYRGPVRAISLAILIGVVAVWFRRSPGPFGSMSAFISRWTS